MTEKLIREQPDEIKPWLERTYKLDSKGLIIEQVTTQTAMQSEIDDLRVALRASEPRIRELEKDAERWREYLSHHAPDQRESVIAAIDAALAKGKP